MPDLYVQTVPHERKGPCDEHTIKTDVLSIKMFSAKNLALKVW